MLCLLSLSPLIISTQAASIPQPNADDFAFPDVYETQTNTNTFLGDSTLSFSPHLDKTHNQYHPDEEQEQEKQKQKLPILIEKHILVVEPEQRKAPILKGHGFFLMGLFFLALCFSMIRSDASLKEKSFFEGVDTTVQRLLDLKSVARGLLVLLSLSATPVFLAIGTAKLVRTLPSYVKWAKDNDELGLAELVLLTIYGFLFVLDSAA